MEQISIYRPQEYLTVEDANLLPNEPTATTYRRAALLGFAAGLRSQMPLALLANGANQRARAQNDPLLLRLLSRPTARIGFSVAAGGELIVDKLPIAPSRLEPQPLLGRLALGALAGAGRAATTHRSTSLGALLGAAGAAAGSFAGYHTRRTLTQKTGLPDPIWAIAEDALAFTLATLGARTSPPVIP